MSSAARSLRNEADHLPTTIEDLAELRATLIASGHTPRQADGLVAWILAKVAGQTDTTASDTRARYRKILADLAGQPRNRPGSGRPGPREGDRLAAHNHRSAAVMSAAERILAAVETPAETAARRSRSAKKSRATAARLRAVR